MGLCRRRFTKEFKEAAEAAPLAPDARATGDANRACAV